MKLIDLALRTRDPQGNELDTSYSYAASNLLLSNSPIIFNFFYKQRRGESGLKLDSLGSSYFLESFLYLEPIRHPYQTQIYGQMFSLLMAFCPQDLCQKLFKKHIEVVQKISENLSNPHILAILKQIYCNQSFKDYLPQLSTKIISNIQEALEFEDEETCDFLLETFYSLAISPGADSLLEEFMIGSPSKNNQNFFEILVGHSHHRSELIAALNDLLNTSLSKSISQIISRKIFENYGRIFQSLIQFSNEEGSKIKQNFRTGTDGKEFPILGIKFVNELTIFQRCVHLNLEGDTQNRQELDTSVGMGEGETSLEVKNEQIEGQIKHDYFGHDLSIKIAQNLIVSKISLVTSL